MRMPLVCIITGGIGSGKSVVSRVCRLKGFPVYDCDSRAKSLMDSSVALKHELNIKTGCKVVGYDGVIDRGLLSSMVFGNDGLRAWLNSEVHGMVRDDIVSWVSQQESGIVFIETAIPATSGLDLLADEIWLVDANIDLRKSRVMARSGLDETQVMDRIKSQDNEYVSIERERICRHIDNNGEISLLSQIDILIGKLISKLNNNKILC